MRKSHEKPLSTTPKVESGRSQTNWKGDKKCFQCGKFGHPMYNFPDHNVKPVLSGARGSLEQGKPEVSEAKNTEWEASSNTN